MRRIQIIGGICLLALLSGGAIEWGLRQPGPTEQRKEEQAALMPSDSVVEIVRDLPPVLEEEAPSLQVDFPLTNDTGDTVKYRLGATSCSCSRVAFLSKDTLGPGEKTTVRMTIRVTGRTGPQVIRTSVVGDNRVTHVFTARLKVFRRANLSQSVLTFANVVPQQERSAAVHFETRASDGARPPGLIGATAHSPLVEVHTREVKEVEVGPDDLPVRKWEIALRLKPEVDADGQTLVTCDYQEGKTKRNVCLVVTWRVRNFFTVAPKRLFWGVPDEASGVHEKEIRLRCADGRPFVVRSIKSFSPLVRCVVAAGGKTEHCLMVTLNPVQPQEPLHGFLEIETDVVEQPVLKIPVTVFCGRLTGGSAGKERGEIDKTSP